MDTYIINIENVDNKAMKIKVYQWKRFLDLSIEI